MAEYKIEQWVTEDGHQVTLVSKESIFGKLMEKGKAFKEGFADKHPKIAKAGKTAGKVALVVGGAAAAVGVMKGSEALQAPTPTSFPEQTNQVPEAHEPEPEPETPFDE